MPAGAPPERSAALAEEARRIAGRGARVRVARSERTALASAIAELRHALVVVAGDGPLSGGGVEELLVLGAPVLVVR